MSALRTAREAQGSEDDDALIDRTLAGDTTAFRGLVEKYQDRVHAVAYGMVRNHEESRDITQEAFVRVYPKLAALRQQGAPVRAWLFRTAMNLSIDFIRQRQRRKQSSFDENIDSLHEDHVGSGIYSAGPLRDMERKELLARILDALEQLPEDQREILLLRELEGFTYSEIAEVMEVPEGTVMSRLFYARKKLQKILSEDPERKEIESSTE